jgi:protein involved in sex pheromone biosynthesis
MMRFKLTALALSTVLSGCGAEVASTAVTTTKLQASQAEQAKAQAEQVKKNVEEAMRKAEAAASAAADK